VKRPRLITQILTINLFMVTAAIFVASLASGLDLSVQAQRWQFATLAGAWLGTFLLNWFLLRRRFAPLDRLLDAMEQVDLSKPGRRFILDPKLTGQSTDMQRLTASFNRMLDRLERERLRSGERALNAQEAERKRVARDLHDEVNQALTALLLRIEAAIQEAPPKLAEELQETKRLANQAMSELLDLARQLRPTALDDHGLVAALRANVRAYDRRGPARANFWADSEFEGLPSDVQTVIYRVAQEAMTNAGRHSGAKRIDVSLSRTEAKVRLLVSDDGCGFAFADDDLGHGLGLSGMRERALLVGGKLTIDSRQGQGTTIVLEVPVKSPAHEPAGQKDSNKATKKSSKRLETQPT
jgi:two-component system sensor histidine kinase UhpB